MSIDAPVAVISSEAKTPIVAVTELYYNACVLGNLKLSPSQATVLKEDPVSGGADRAVGIALPRESATYLHINYIEHTFLSMVTFKKTAHSKLASSCTVSTGMLNLEDGYKVFASFSKDRPIRGVPFFINTWYLDHPKQGYRQVYSNYSRKWATFTTEIFADRKSQPGEKEPQ